MSEEPAVRLARLANRYRQERSAASGPPDLEALHRRLSDRSERTILDAAAAACAVGPIAMADRLDIDAIDPQMREAFTLAYPNLTLEDLSGSDPARILGIAQGWKGKYFEVLVRDRLNAGEAVGDLSLRPGQVAVLAPSPNHPGTDLFIEDGGGAVVDEIQLKATDSVGYIKNALERYPTVRVLPTDEAFRDGIAGLTGPSGIADADLESAIAAPLEDLADGPVEEALEGLLPMLPFVLIAFGEGRCLLTGRKSFRRAVADGSFRVVKSGAAIGVGALVAAADGGWLSLPAAFLTRIGFDRARTLSLAGRAVARRIARSSQLAQRYA